MILGELLFISPSITTIAIVIAFCAVLVAYELYQKNKVKA